MKESKINVKPLGKTFTFAASVGATLHLMDSRIIVAQAEKIENDKKSDEVAVLQAQVKEAKTMVDLVVDILGMTDEEKEQLLNNATVDEIADILTEISDILNGITPDDRKKSGEEQN